MEGTHHLQETTAQHSHTCTYKHTYTHYRVGVDQQTRGKNEMIFTDTSIHDDIRLSIYLWMISRHLEPQTYTHIWGHILNARVTLPFFIYIQNTLSLWCWYSDNSPPHTLTHTHTHPLTIITHTHTFALKTLTPSWGAGGWGIATTHFASMQPPSKQSGDA